MEKELNTSMNAAGINFKVRNHAMGNNPVLPASFCLNSQLGLDTDIAVWEFGMMIGRPDLAAYAELWMRNAISLPKQPVVMFLDPGGGARKADGEGKLPTEPRGGTPEIWSE